MGLLQQILCQLHLVDFSKVIMSDYQHNKLSASPLIPMGALEAPSVEVFIIFTVLDFIQTMLIPIPTLITIIPYQLSKFTQTKNISIVIIQFLVDIVVIY